MSRAVNTEALIATINNLADRADELLAMQGEAAHPDLAGKLFTLGRDIQECSHELAHAVTGLHILTRLSHRLHHRTWACAQVFGTTRPSESNFVVTTSVSAQSFGKRFVDSVPSDEDNPF